MLVAYYAGLRPAILTATLSGLAAWWFWIGPPGFDFAVATLVAIGFYVRRRGRRLFHRWHGRREAATGAGGRTQRRAGGEPRHPAAEVQHRVSNNIQVVSALLSLEARDAIEPGARKALADASARTALVARIQRSLADTDRQAATFSTIARSIIDDALTAAARDDVEVSISSDGVVLSAEEATPVVLVMLECVNNALEHAFPASPGVFASACPTTGRFGP